MPNLTLRELIFGQGAHVNPIACIEDLPLDLANQTVANYPHSIWQIVEHMNYWMEYELRRIACAAPAATAAQWHSATERFAALLDHLARLADADAETLSQAIAPDKDKAARPVTVENIVTQISAHNSYHVGQIALLRRQLNAWPPKSGGDTW